MRDLSVIYFMTFLYVGLKVKEKKKIEELK